MNLYTDYPLVEFGDTPGKEAPIRMVQELIEYDGDKYVTVRCLGEQFHFKRCYLYTKRGRCCEVPAITDAEIAQLLG